MGENEYLLCEIAAGRLGEARAVARGALEQLREARAVARAIGRGAFAIAARIVENAESRLTNARRRGTGED